MNALVPAHMEIATFWELGASLEGLAAALRAPVRQVRQTLGN